MAYAVPVYFLLWGLLFHAVLAGIFFRFTTNVPFLGCGAGAQTVKIVFFLANFIGGAIGHAAPFLGLPLELVETIFLVSVVVSLLALLCTYRCFFLDFSLGRALLSTALGLFFSIGPSPLFIAPLFGINDFKTPSTIKEVHDSLATNKDAGCMHHIAGECMLLVVMLSWFMILPNKVHKA